MSQPTDWIFFAGGLIIEIVNPKLEIEQLPMFLRFVCVTVLPLFFPIQTHVNDLYN